MPAAKKKQKPKKGKVIRVAPNVQRLLEKTKRKNETWTQFIERLVGRTAWALPSDLFGTRGEATGEAIARAARERRALEEVEEPIKVREGL